MNGLLAFGCVGGMAVAFLTWGILTRLGYLRASYALKGHPVAAPRTLIYGLIPLGLGLGLLAILPLVPEGMRPDLVSYGLGPLWILTLILAIWQPWWLKPGWVRWLEKEHGDILGILWEEVRKEGHAWERRVRTQEQLEAWVAEVRRKHRLEKH
jgi:hypothetical protein